LDSSACWPAGHIGHACCALTTGDLSVTGNVERLVEGCGVVDERVATDFGEFSYRSRFT